METRVELGKTAKSNARLYVNANSRECNSQIQGQGTGIETLTAGEERAHASIRTFDANSDGSEAWAASDDNLSNLIEKAQKVASSQEKRGVAFITWWENNARDKKDTVMFRHVYNQGWVRGLDLQKLPGKGAKQPPIAFKTFVNVAVVTSLAQRLGAKTKERTIVNIGAAACVEKAGSSTEYHEIICLLKQLSASKAKLRDNPVNYKARDNMRLHLPLNGGYEEFRLAPLSELDVLLHGDSSSRRLVIAKNASRQVFYTRNHYGANRYMDPIAYYYLGELNDILRRIGC